jgi:hypothetical protein
MAQNIAVGMPIEIIPGITPDIFGGGGVLTRDEYNIQDYQTNIANVERLGSMNNPDLPSGTVLVCHGNRCSIYSINHIRPYDPEENNMSNRSNNGNNRSTVVENNNSTPKNKNNASTKSGYEIFGFKLFGGKRKTGKTGKTRKTRKTRKLKTRKTKNVRR